MKELTEEQIDKYEKEFLQNKEEIKTHFVINEKPCPLQRPRKGRGNFFYNPSSSIETKYKKLCLAQLPAEDYEKIKKLMENPDSIYYVHYDIDFYVPIQKSDSQKNKELKERKIIRPSIRNGDIDNYIKLILDALHDVLYDDDKVVIDVKGNKYYSYNARTEINATIEIIKY